MQPEKKPSFFNSVMSGVAGFVKGTLAGGITGVVLGAAAGALIGLFSGGAIPMAMIGASLLGSTMASVGGMAGTMTGVVKSREKSQVSEQDVVNIANIAYAQGVSSGIELSQNKARGGHADRLLKEREERATQPEQRVH